ncbi:MAG TPA: XRE family transcriptional regulator [Noviherbaspirillum sp.]|uniref:XRE family transcriptional regulator n=1 Tax=Noviherbaspirillum sp. TaxID=1926288 RepID=UPI002B46414B|nr:XRE family transcriptional regulator [Noviherbaspirillum sp.]HJV84540.1 XRE family transcriptional regulator [Noviherbaspirillum sp.]
MRKMKRRKLRAMHGNVVADSTHETSVRTADVWEAICDTPEEAADMRIRTRIIFWIIKVVEYRRWSYATAARQCDLTPERLQALLRGRISQFTVTELEAIAARLRQNNDV